MDGMSSAQGISNHGWAAPVADGPVAGTVAVPGSKSLTNRALILAAQATGPSTLTAPLRSRDTTLMAAGLRALGVGVTAGTGDWLVEPGPLNGPAAIDCGLAGTVMRFLPPLAATAPGVVTFDGDPHARTRPMGTVLDALRGLGAQIDGDRLPFTLHGVGALRGGRVVIDAAASSQFVSGLLLSGARFTEGVTVVHDGKPVPVDAAHRHDGAGVARGRRERRRLRGRHLAGAPGSRGAVDGAHRAGPVQRHPVPGSGRGDRRHRTISHWPATTTQAGAEIRAILAADGLRGRARRRTDLTVTGPDRLTGIDIDLHDVSELTPTVAALAALADGPSHLRGIAHIRGHETDRLSALAADLTGLGGHVTEDRDALHITGGVTHGGRGPPTPTTGWPPPVPSSASGCRGVLVDDIDCTAKTLPDFARMWHDLLTGAPVRTGVSTLGDRWDNDDVRVRPGTLAPARAPRPDPGTPTRSAASCSPSTAVATAAWSSAETARSAWWSRCGPASSAAAGSPSATGSTWSGDTSGDPTPWPGSSGSSTGPRCCGAVADDMDTAERIVVANADQLVIVCALVDPVPRPGFIDRCLVAAYAGNLDPILVLTKADLADPADSSPPMRACG